MISDPFYAPDSEGEEEDEPEQFRPSTLGADRVCAWCNEPSGDRCGGCKLTSYCSKECQKNDWKTHKHICKTYAEMSPRPDEGHYLAIFFPSLTKKPSLHWVNLASWRDHLAEGGPNTLGGYKVRNRNARTGKKMADVAFYHREEAHFDGSVRNESILAATNGLCKHRIPGGVIVNGDGRDGYGADATPWIYRFAIDLFCYHNPYVVNGVVPVSGLK